MNVNLEGPAAPGSQHDALSGVTAPTQEKASSRSLLPCDLWLEIQRHADGKSLLALRGTCHTLRELRPPMSQLVCRLQAIDPGFRPAPDANGEFLMAHLATRLHTIDDVAACIREPGALRPARSLSGHEDAVVSASFSPDGRFVVTASDDSTAKVWDLRLQARSA